MSIQKKITEIEAHAVEVPVARYIDVAKPAARPRAGRAGVKRALDLAIAVPALVVLAPVLLTIAILIKLDSRGPVFFRQTRTGLGGVPFDILKFRSMGVCENGDHIMQARQNDPRVTRIGRTLRRTSLDELPQLINVLKGEMSLIGPRPHAMAHDRLYATLIANYPLRQLVKPGISGWAQVNGHRGETPTIESMRARVEHDLWYARNQTFALDVEILFRTFIEIFRHTNAY